MLFVKLDPQGHGRHRHIAPPGPEHPADRRQGPGAGCRLLWRRGAHAAPRRAGAARDPLRAGARRRVLVQSQAIGPPHRPLCAPERHVWACSFGAQPVAGRRRRHPAGAARKGRLHHRADRQEICPPGQRFPYDAELAPERSGIRDVALLANETERFIRAAGTTPFFVTVAYSGAPIKSPGGRAERAPAYARSSVVRAQFAGGR